MKINEVGLNNQKNRESWLKKILSEIPAGSKILDAGAGELQYKIFCNHLNYVSQDFGKYNGVGNYTGLQTFTWDQSRLDIVSDITQIPCESNSFDAIMCIEVFEHLPEPIMAIKEFARLLKSKGYLILTVPFCSLTHFAPHHYYTGFNKYFFEKFLHEYSFEIIDLVVNGNYFEYLGQEVRRVESVAEKYSNKRTSYIERRAIDIFLKMLNRFSQNDQSSNELLSFGINILGKKK